MTKARALKYSRWASQGGFLLLFFWLFLETESKGFDKLGYPVRLFLDFDPLVLVTTLLSSHAAPRAFYLSIILVVLTVVLGRFFCGWVCPLGTLNNMVGAASPKSASRPRPGLRKVKYYILIFLLASSAFTLQLAGLLDPLSLLIRSLTLSVYPAFSFAAGSVFDALYRADVPVLSGVSEAVYEAIREPLLPFKQPHFHQAAFIGSIFLLVLGLNFIERRFWCRNLCPLGALLGVLSRYSLLKRSVTEGCTECGICAGACPGGAEPDTRGGWHDAECYDCFNCDDICPQNAVRFDFRGSRERAAMDLGRRRVLVSAVAGAAFVPLLRVGPADALPNPRRIRPPGAREEGEFLARCIRCGECMKVCITGGLQPTLLEAGVEGLWTPVLVPRIGYCEYRCTLCGQVCPTGAIEELPLEKKMKVKLGLAMINKNRCLPWAHGTPCIVCEEVCPTPKKAVWFRRERVTLRDGSTVELKRPEVDLDLCIGCGICEAKCPVVDRPAIYVTSIGESRDPENVLLL